MSDAPIQMPPSAEEPPVLNKAELQDLANMMMGVTIQASSIDAFLTLKNKIEAMIPHAPDAPPPPMAMPPQGGQQ